LHYLEELHTELLADLVFKVHVIKPLLLAAWASCNLAITLLELELLLRKDIERRVFEVKHEVTFLVCQLWLPQYFRRWVFIAVDLLLVRFLDFLFFAALAGAGWLSAKTCNFDRWCIECFENAYLSVLQI
jgi:hypothetical protein